MYNNISEKLKEAIKAVAEYKPTTVSEELIQVHGFGMVTHDQAKAGADHHVAQVTALHNAGNYAGAAIHAELASPFLKALQKHSENLGANAPKDHVPDPHAEVVPAVAHESVVGEGTEDHTRYAPDDVLVLRNKVTKLLQKALAHHGAGNFDVAHEAVEDANAASRQHIIKYKQQVQKEEVVVTEAKSKGKKKFQKVAAARKKSQQPYSPTDSEDVPR